MLEYGGWVGDSAMAVGELRAWGVPDPINLGGSGDAKLD